MNARFGSPICAAMLLTGCAAAPPDHASSAPTAVQAASPRAPSASVSKLASNKRPLDPRDMDTGRYAREMGYRKETRHGVEFYCRRVAPLGSRLEEKQCLTAQGMQEAVEIMEQNKANFQQSHLCQGPQCEFK
jgi:hypothetical protein